MSNYYKYICPRKRKSTAKIVGLWKKKQSSE
nr:MAG TPA: hypothetical protein [Caudoviricetes sp.]